MKSEKFHSGSISDFRPSTKQNPSQFSVKHFSLAILSFWSSLAPMRALPLLGFAVILVGCASETSSETIGPTSASLSATRYQNPHSFVSDNFPRPIQGRYSYQGCDSGLPETAEIRQSRSKVVEKSILPGFGIAGFLRSLRGESSDYLVFASYGTHPNPLGYGYDHFVEARIVCINTGKLVWTSKSIHPRAKDSSIDIYLEDLCYMATGKFPRAIGQIE
jgi:hypothetical protein